ncbi:MAG: heavy metal translocating P-type ATPase metal-binding domain-containing protein [Bacteroidota bacterium]|nr:heavy metal translocating P-type ATPase metal-binding domain-containing protein [Bacteroidota bacterium]MDP3145806.1 heavy metal translocating P-type ATPase metal-binding domain-containing protein [Bacteroidota bacterium]
MIVKDKPEQKTICFHCGEDAQDQSFKIEAKLFCCRGCQTVYEIINKNNLCSYYDNQNSPGINQKQPIRNGKFDFLDDEKISNQLIYFQDKSQKHVIFYLPQMHCSSCIWILEHLNNIDKGIIKSQVNFIKKEVSIIFDFHQTNLKKVAESLALIGYEPHISLNDADKSKIKKYDTTKIVKIGIAGFCFGNIMMLSFPDYFSIGKLEDPNLKFWFNYLNLLLSLPVFFYCAAEFFISGFKGLRQKFLNIDAPIALAILITFSRSVYEIISDTGSGYLDSMSGIVFFMLIGRYFQNKTYQNISFDRDFTSYFPLGVIIINSDGSEKQVSVSELKVGDRIKIHNDEIIPADSILFLGKATIDYSFVTGESIPVEKSIGEIVYAGGKQTSGAIELEVIKKVSQSYLTQLWNNEVFKDTKDEQKVSFIHKISKYFTYVLFSIAIIAATYWLIFDNTKVWGAVTAILIVACPCALLLSSTFTNGNMIRILNKYKLYVKNASVIEKISDVDTIVFDKTGTITEQVKSQIIFNGMDLSSEHSQLIRSLANQSNHPLSKSIISFLPFSKNLNIKNFKEFKGFGTSGLVNNHFLKMGSSEFVLGQNTIQLNSGSKVYISIDDEFTGYFNIKNNYRKDLEKIVTALGKNFDLKILSGDNDSEKNNLENIFGNKTEMLFNQKPEDKLIFIQQLQDKGKKVLMIGDGLNDAGALKQSNVGIAISDNTNNFSPACDAILSGNNFYLLKELINYCRKGKTIIYSSFIISVLYNFVGLFFAVQGDLKPVIAAILMPISSISIVLLTTSLSSYYERRLTKT